MATIKDYEKDVSFRPGSRRRFGRLRHFALAPNFAGIKERLVLQEVMRYSHKVALFYRVFPPAGGLYGVSSSSAGAGACGGVGGDTEFDPRQGVVSCLEAFSLVRPRKGRKRRNWREQEAKRDEEKRKSVRRA